MQRTHRPESRATSVCTTYHLPMSYLPHHVLYGAEAGGCSRARACQRSPRGGRGGLHHTLFPGETALQGLPTCHAVLYAAHPAYGLIDCVTVKLATLARPDCPPLFVNPRARVRFSERAAGAPLCSFVIRCLNCRT